VIYTQHAYQVLHLSDNDSAYFDWIIILFMFLGGMTFMLFYHMMQGNWRVIRVNTEFRWYVGFMLFFLLWCHGSCGRKIPTAA